MFFLPRQFHCIPAYTHFVENRVLGPPVHRLRSLPQISSPDYIDNQSLVGSTRSISIPIRDSLDKLDQGRRWWYVRKMLLKDLIMYVFHHVDSVLWGQTRASGSGFTLIISFHLALHCYGGILLVLPVSTDKLLRQVDPTSILSSDPASVDAPLFFMKQHEA